MVPIFIGMAPRVVRLNLSFEPLNSPFEGEFTHFFKNIKTSPMSVKLSSKKGWITLFKGQMVEKGELRKKLATQI